MYVKQSPIRFCPSSLMHSRVSLGDRIHSGRPTLHGMPVSVTKVTTTFYHELFLGNDPENSIGPRTSCHCCCILRSLLGVNIHLHPMPFLDLISPIFTGVFSSLLE